MLQKYKQQIKSMENTYIALDLETTGFDPATDEVLEIAAIKFQGEKILETFQTLVKPATEIPAMVSHITGITVDTVREAPTFEDVRDNLSIFLGNLPIVGHNIEFDLTFLEAKGIPILSPQFDTLKLSAILLPRLPSYSLDTISRQLKIVHDQKHRAYSDALVCVKLFNLLVEKIKTIPAPLLREIREIAERGEWDLAKIFTQTDSTAKTNKRRPVSATKTPEPLPATPPVDDKRAPHTAGQPQNEDIVELLGSKSPLAGILKNYEYRPGQQTFFLKILEAAQEGHHLIAEAGTGTGKTMAYLLAAAALRTQSGKKTIISTHTNHLQDQIIEKEFPLIRKLFPGLTITVLKGRRKYLDRSRLQILRDKPLLEEHEISALIKILLWLEETKNGDLDELNLQNKEVLIYDQICSDPDGLHHPQTATGQDFLEQARARAEDADLVIVNHALLTQDSLMENSILPDADVLIVDEAHHLEKTLTDAQTVIFGENRPYKLWENLFEAGFKHINPEQFFPERWPALLERLKTERQLCLENIPKIFRLLETLMSRFSSAPPGLGMRLAIDQKLRADPQWQQTLGLLVEMEQQTPRIAQLCRDISTLFQDLPVVNEQIGYALHEIERFFLQISAFTGDANHQITWINKNFDDSIHLATAPLAIDQTFGEKVTSPYSTVVLTSATLSTYGNFNYLRRELGLEENYEQILIPSHFSYPDQVKIIIPEDLSDPRDSDYLNQCRQIISDVIQKNGGRTLVLFTAKKDLAHVFHNLAPSLKSAGYNLLAQNISGGRGKILAHFQDEPDRCAILGTNSFWEGVDLIGPVLTCVIIQKLPFDPPDDPIIKARSARFEKPFEQYALPRAILRFKQGFGRLIRSAEDTGAVIILDSRLVQKSYGQEFVSSLPSGIKIHQCARGETSEFI